MKEEEKIILSRAEIPNDAKDLRIATEIAQNFAKYIWGKAQEKQSSVTFLYFDECTDKKAILMNAILMDDLKQILQIEEIESKEQEER